MTLLTQLPSVHVVKSCTCPVPLSTCPRDWRKCSGNCSPDDPCTPEQSAFYRLTCQLKEAGLPLSRPVTMIWGPEADRNPSAEEIQEMVQAHYDALGCLNLPSWPSPDAVAAVAPPKLLDKARRWGQAWLRWAVAGFPKRTRKQVAAALAVCSACEHYSSDGCKLCGCPKEPLLLGLAGLKRKATFATEHCPLGKW